MRWALGQGVPWVLSQVVAGGHRVMVSYHCAILCQIIGRFGHQELGRATQ